MKRDSIKVFALAFTGISGCFWLLYAFTSQDDLDSTVSTVEYLLSIKAA